MKSFGILIGISFMLVGALAYAMPAQPENMMLVPALAGVVMAIGSLLAQKNKAARKKILLVNAIVSAALIINCAIRIVPDWLRVEMENNRMNLIADVNVLGLSIAFLTAALSSLFDKKNADTEIV